MALYVGTSNLAHAKGGCYVCTRNEDLVDLDVQIVGEGALVLCKFCIQDAAEAAGLHVNAAAVAEMRVEFAADRQRFDPARIEELEADLHSAREALTHEQRTVATLQDALSRVGRNTRSKTPAST